jgi:hypothetical protein
MFNDVRRQEGYYTRESRDPIAGDRGGNDHSTIVF